MMVGQLFNMFEDLTAAHGMTKVDIIGDCFMAVSGMLEPEDTSTSAVKAARLVRPTCLCSAAVPREQVAFKRAWRRGVLTRRCCRCTSALPRPHTCRRWTW